jgi:hypothetical protein
MRGLAIGLVVLVLITGVLSARYWYRSSKANVRRGLLRLWIACSLCWVTVSAAHFVINGPKYCVGPAPGETGPCVPTWATDEMLSAVAWTVLPPLALFVVGVMACWVVNGFRSP